MYVCMYTYIYIYVCMSRYVYMCVYISIYIYIYIDYIFLTGTKACSTFKIIKFLYANAKTPLNA